MLERSADRVNFARVNTFQFIVFMHCSLFIRLTCTPLQCVCLPVFAVIYGVCCMCNLYNVLIKHSVRQCTICFANDKGAGMGTAVIWALIRIHIVNTLPALPVPLQYQPYYYHRATIKDIAGYGELLSTGMWRYCFSHQVHIRVTGRHRTLQGKGEQ